LASAWFERLGGEGALDVAYRPSWRGADEEQIDRSAREQLAQARADEYRRGVTLSGPHRDDVRFALDGIPLRASGSQGQWRTAMLAVRLAERAVMAAELDPQRQRRVLESGTETQVIVTATALPETETDVRCLRIEAGTVTGEAWSRRSGIS
jgi:DNA replication and repair protein RecF